MRLNIELFRNPLPGSNPVLHFVRGRRFKSANYGQESGFL